MKSVISQAHLKTAIDAVRSAKLRSLWTMLGVIIGVSSVITVVAIGQGIKQQIGNQINNFGQNLITVRPSQLKTLDDSGNTGLNLLSGLNINAPLTAKDVDTVARSKGVDASAPLTIASGTVHGDNGVYKDGLVLGTTSDLPSLINQSMAYGVFLTLDDVGTNTAVLGQHAADKLFNVDVPLGRRFQFHGQQFVVRGIFEHFNTTPLSQQADFNNAIFIPNDVAESLANNSAPTYAILARPTTNKQTDQAAANIKRELSRSHGGQSNFEVLRGSQDATASQAILDLLTRLIAGIAAISLLVGGIGIMNVMLVSVTERMHEIGIRKAIGATNQQILGQFIIESSLLSLAGGVIGIILAFLVDVVLRIATSLKPEISWQVVLLASGVSLIVGIVFGSVPAIKAARKDPIEALRAE